MANTIPINCPWCRSRHQTMDVLGFMRAREASGSMHRSDDAAVCLSLKCRGCGSFVCSTVVFKNIAEALRLLNSGSGDLTKLGVNPVAYCPPLDTTISEAIPEIVRDSLVDAHESSRPRPRAKCMHFRSAIEFALREADVSAEAGATLGAILKKARQNYALPEALIDLCDQVKAFGNWGIHWAETEIEADDADAAQKITEAILLYLFELPALVDQAKVRTESAKQAHQNNSSP